MAADWAAVLQEVYGEDFTAKATQLIDWEGTFFLGYRTPGLTTESTKAMIDKWIEDGGYDRAGEELEKALKEALAFVDPNGIVAFAMEKLGTPLWSLLAEETKQQIAQGLINDTNGQSEAYQIFKSLFHLDDETASKYISYQYQRIFEDAEQSATYEPPVEVSPTLVNADEAMESIKEQIQEAMGDGVFSLDEQMKIKTTFADYPGLYEDALKELQLNLDEEGYNRGAIPRAGRMIAAAGLADFSYAPHAGSSQESTSEDQLVAGVTAGVKSANESQNVLLQDVVRILTRIAGKDFSVNIVPSSSYGMLNEKSAEQFARVTGG
jgi:hypothetical protein